MLTNMNFPNYAWSTASPALLHDRIPTFLREAHQLKLTLNPIPQTTDHRPGSGNRVSIQ